jgi:hypothetical protein
MNESKTGIVEWISVQVWVVIALILYWPADAQVCLAASPEPPSGHALLLSDIHFDPLADVNATIVKELSAAPVSQWQDILATASAGSGYAHFPNDTNYPLLKSALSAAAQYPIDFVIASGDYLRHDFQNAFVKTGGSPSDFPTFATKTTAFVVDTIRLPFEFPYISLWVTTTRPAAITAWRRGGLF